MGLVVGELFDDAAAVELEGSIEPAMHSLLPAMPADEGANPGGLGLALCCRGRGVELRETLRVEAAESEMGDPSQARPLRVEIMKQLRDQGADSVAESGSGDHLSQRGRRGDRSEFCGREPGLRSHREVGSTR